MSGSFILNRLNKESLHSARLVTATYFITYAAISRSGFEPAGLQLHFLQFGKP